ncbi:MAG: hypothetical protein JRD05_10635, partial [Deltaproteobacteria bacterium]|nr:hypothetical protein [Deltaproteobacteria bacterium]
MSGCCLFRQLCAKRPPIQLTTSSGIETAEFQLHDSIMFEAVNLSPRAGYTVQIAREDGEIITQSILSTDRYGRIPRTVLWYDIGILPCSERPGRAHVMTNLSDYEISDVKRISGSYALRIVQEGRLVREMPFSIAREITKPRLYASDWRGCPQSGFLIGEQDVWVVGKNFPKGSIIRLWAVPADPKWEESDLLKDVTKQYDTELTPLFELKGYEDSFKKLLWPKGTTSIGSYDIVAEVVTYPFGTYHPTATAPVKNVVSNLSYSGFVIQRRQGLGEPLEQDLAGTRMSKLAMRDTFLTTEDVYAGVDPYVQPSYIGQTAHVYIVADKTDALWTSNTGLSDVTGVVESVEIQPGTCANAYSRLAWAAPLIPGQYDVVLDFDTNGQYDHGGDLVDSLDPVGFTVAEVRVESISFNYSGSGAITIYDNTNGTNITAPEYSCGPCDTIQPAAWVMGSTCTVRVEFKAAPSVSSAQIWAENGLGGLNSSGSPVTVSFSGGNGQGTFTVNSVPAFIGKHVFDWVWKYKNVNGTPSSALEMGTTADHVVYTVLASSQAPQTQPWLGVLEIACDLADSQTTASAAMREIWYDFYHDAGGVYDTFRGAPHYPVNLASGRFELTKWLNNYATASIGTVNCYDMGKSVVVFANALGCNANYTYVGSFGYLNCVKPIGKGWTNNPFYDGYGTDP